MAVEGNNVSRPRRDRRTPSPSFVLLVVIVEVGWRLFGQLSNDLAGPVQIQPGRTPSDSLRRGIQIEGTVPKLHHTDPVPILSICDQIRSRNWMISCDSVERHSLAIRRRINRLLISEEMLGLGVPSQNGLLSGEGGVQLGQFIGG